SAPKTGKTWTEREKRAAVAEAVRTENARGGFPRLSLGCGCLRLAAAPRGCVARHLRCAFVAQIGGLRAAPCVGIREAQRRTLVLSDFLFAVVADKDRLSSQRFLLRMDRTRGR